MANGRFVNDYSFLNLPELGSAVRSPIETAQASLPPSILQNINFSAPQELPEADLLTRGGTPNIIPTRPQGILGTPNFRNILQTAVGNAEAEIQMLREAKVDLTNQYEQAVAQQDALTAQAAEDQLAAVNAKEQELLTERANIIAELEQGFGVEREGLQTNIANLEGTVTDLQANIDALTQERDAAIAEQDVIRATAAEDQAKALADQRADLQGQIDTLSASQPSVAGTTQVGMPTPPANTYNPDYMGFEDERMIGRQDEMMAPPPVQQQAFPVTGQDLGLRKQPNLPVTNPEPENYGPIRRDTIPTDVVSQLQNMNIQQPNLNFNNLRLGMAGGGDINKIEILLKRLG
jgi:multidrug efflux pump subunit AcrA (membrane-fusion protein)